MKVQRFFLGFKKVFWPRNILQNAKFEGEKHVQTKGMFFFFPK